MATIKHGGDFVPMTESARERFGELYDADEFARLGGGDLAPDNAGPEWRPFTGIDVWGSPEAVAYVRRIAQEAEAR